MDNREEFWAAFIALIIGLALGFVFGWNCGSNAIRTEAVEHGAAGWKVNPDRSTEFIWLDQIKKEN